MNKFNERLDLVFGLFVLLLWVFVFSLWAAVPVQAAGPEGFLVYGASPSAPVRDPAPNELKLFVEPVPSYTAEELDIMAHLLCGECQTGSEELQKAVGSVVLNRVNHQSYPNDIRSVVFQRGQYACTWDGNYYRTPTERNWEVADWLLRNGSTLPPNVIFQAQFRQGHGVYARIGSEVFCYE